MDLSNRCRCCLSNDKESLQTLEEATTLHLFEQCLGTKISFKPVGLPTNICSSCFGRCLAWKSFKQQYDETNALLGFKFGSGIAESTVNIKQENQSPEPHPVPATATESLIPNNDPSEQGNFDNTIDFQEEKLVQSADGDVQNGNLVDNQTTETLQPIDNINSGSPIDVQQVLIPEEKKIECTECKTQFKSLANMRRHQRRFHKSLSDLHRCFICDQVFTSERSLLTHLQQHPNKTQFTCLLCNKRFKTGRGVIQHCLGVHRCHLHVCDLCPSTFGYVGDLEDHKLEHTEERLSVCNKCQKSFRDNSTMLAHLLTHRSENENLQV